MNSFVLFQLSLISLPDWYSLPLRHSPLYTLLPSLPILSFKRVLTSFFINASIMPYVGEPQNRHMPYYGNHFPDPHHPQGLLPKTILPEKEPVWFRCLAGSLFPSPLSQAPFLHQKKKEGIHLIYRDLPPWIASGLKSLGGTQDEINLKSLCWC